MDQNTLLRQLWEDLEPALLAQGYSLVEVEVTGGPSGGRILRLYIDKPGGGITLDDCTAATHVLNPVLDAGDYFSDAYYLEVSSPGIDRPVRKPEDFARFAGEPIRLQTQAPVRDRKRFNGILKGFQDGLIAVECEEGVIEIHIENLKKAQLDR